MDRNGEQNDVLKGMTCDVYIFVCVWMQNVMVYKWREKK